MNSWVTGEGDVGAAAVQKTTLQFLPKIVTFEHRHENKTCSACREWLNERLKECESEKEWDSEREWEWESVRVSFEHRDKNKSCSACRERVNERMRARESVRVSARVWECESVKVREWLLSIDMKTKVVQHVESEWMREWKSESETMREWESERGVRG